MQRRARHASSDGTTVVAQSPLLTIEACDCGVMHLHFGALSMRLTAEAMESVGRTISEALLRTGVEEPVQERITSVFSKAGPVRGEA